MKTYDCPPTLTDTQVLEVCKQGYLILEGVVPEEINQRTLAFVEANPSGEPTEILDEDWFVEQVICQPEAAGAVRSLLGRNFVLPILVSNHRTEMPAEAQRWHRDGGSQYGPAQHYLQVFYYPETCTREMGPTELLPGSHHLFSQSRRMAHYGKIKMSVYAAVPAGSIIITVYSIWHRRSASTETGIRNMLKYNYWRTVHPERDWIIEPDFDVATADYEFDGLHVGEQFRDCYDAAEMYFWLSGKSSEFQLMGGQGWPVPGKRSTKPLGFPGQLTGRRY
ncbi:MAG: hypothetical protein CL878_05545 [Dehalococcoidia bacterium]|nr:hypothetical protein [Dehalococcoidia bacterium]